MKIRKPKKFVKVNDCSLPKTNIRIIDTTNYPYFIIDGRLYLSKNIDTTETFPHTVYDDCGVVLDECDVSDWSVQECKNLNY